MTDTKSYNEGVWCCTKKYRCKWQGCALCWGLGWGTVPDSENEWRKAHDERCDGVLVQLLNPNETPAPAGNPPAEAG